MGGKTCRKPARFYYFRPLQILKHWSLPMTERTRKILKTVHFQSFPLLGNLRLANLIFDWSPLEHNFKMKVLFEDCGLHPLISALFIRVNPLRSEKKIIKVKISPEGKTSKSFEIQRFWIRKKELLNQWGWSLMLGESFEIPFLVICVFVYI